MVIFSPPIEMGVSRFPVLAPDHFFGWSIYPIYNLLVVGLHPHCLVGCWYINIYIIYIYEHCLLVSLATPWPVWSPILLLLVGLYSRTLLLCQYVFVVKKHPRFNAYLVNILRHLSKATYIKVFIDALKLHEFWTTYSRRFTSFYPWIIVDYIL